MSQATHEVFNQSTPFIDVNLFHTDAGLRDALRFNHPGFDAERFSAIGAECGSAQTVEHARLANHHAPVLRSHDRFGHRVDQVEGDQHREALAVEKRQRLVKRQPDNGRM